MQTPFNGQYPKIFAQKRVGKGTPEGGQFTKDDAAGPGSDGSNIYDTPKKMIEAYDKAPAGSVAREKIAVMMYRAIKSGNISKSDSVYKEFAKRISESRRGG